MTDTEMIAELIKRYEATIAHIHAVDRMLTDEELETYDTESGLCGAFLAIQLDMRINKILIPSCANKISLWIDTKIEKGKAYICKPPNYAMEKEEQLQALQIRLDLLKNYPN